MPYMPFGRQGRREETYVREYMEALEIVHDRGPRIAATIAQMTDEQIVEVYGIEAQGAVTALANAAVWKAELASTVGQHTGAPSASANQLLAMTGQ